MDKQKSLFEEYGLIGEPVKWKFKDGTEKTFFVMGGEVTKISSGEIKNIGLMAEITATKTETDEENYTIGDFELYEFYLKDKNLKMKKIEPTDTYYKELSSVFENENNPIAL